jgi:hypothetical protein
MNAAPEVEKASDGATSKALRKRNMNADYSAASPETQTKRLATLTARAALVGVTLHRIEGDFLPEVFIVSRWAMTREFTDMDALEAWLNRVTGKSA